MSAKTIIVSPYPYYSGTLYAPEATGAGIATAGIWYAYFENTPLPADDSIQVVNVAGMGMSGNVELFESLADGVKLKKDAIVQVTAWGKNQDTLSENEWLGLQLDKGGTLLLRAYTAFDEMAANVSYGGVLVPNDIIRVVASNKEGDADAITEGWISVIATPI